MSKAAPENPSVHEMVVKESKDELYDNFSDLESEAKQEKEDVSDSETVTDSPSSQGESQTIKDSKVEKSSRVEKKTAKNNSTDGSSSVSKARKSRSEASKKQTNASHVTPKKSAKSNGGLSKVTDKGAPAHKSKHMKVYPKASSESSEGLDDKSMEELKDFDILKEATNGSQVVGSDNDTADIKENGVDEDQEIVQRKIEEMELKIENLEEELREIAALEIALYSVVPEHGSSAHKVHTPARRLSRLYIHACKNWTQDKRATIARNTVSGLVTIAKACGNDVPRLTFWLSNTIVLREVISQAFGNSVHSSTITRIVESNSGVKRGEGKFPSLKWKGSPGSKQVNMGFTQFIDDWQETRTFTSALEKVESWMFSRIVESVWWQTLTPHMQSPVDGIYSIKNNGKVSGPTLGDPQQGDFAINLWQRLSRMLFKDFVLFEQEGMSVVACQYWLE
ncbi:hypothetical protein GIB67_000387 [Kingdonia uniflora]|uniref:Uncharacterized protein n=1 Tax=Kingdonia uniflora TaxID=39325 RepID=A0A7J7NEP2_9MAGN|nr:hypothetical protein GIB67_000387 [Kingdonia uniflora]